MKLLFKPLQPSALEQLTSGRMKAFLIVFPGMFLAKHKEWLTETEKPLTETQIIDSLNKSNYKNFQDRNKADRFEWIIKAHLMLCVDFLMWSSTTPPC